MSTHTHSSSAAGEKRSTGSSEHRPPNIVVILADDLGCGDMRLYDGWIDTPHINRLAREGMRFTDFHSNSSVCSPTRVAFLTGRYQQRYGIVDVIVGREQTDAGLPPTAPTLPRVFKDNGYATALFGKWHCGHQDQYNPVHHGFDEFVGFLHGGCDYHEHSGWRVGLEQRDVPGYTTHILAEQSIDFIRRNRDNPFLLYMSHAAVHNPYQTPADTVDNRDPELNKYAVNDQNRAKYKVMLEEMDDSVGQIMDTINAMGLADDTVILFFSDNGDVCMSPHDRPFRGGKFSHYEGGHRVPAVACWPGKIPPGTVSDQFVVGFDLFPTFADIADLAHQLPDNLDGQSIKNHLLDQADLPERDIFFGYEPKLGTAMRRGDWKLIVKEEDVQLYNLRDDLKETTNLVSQHPDIARDMREAIDHFKQTVTPGS